jgi:ABC-type branched-subunit amino acid transport system permease subunit
VEGLDLVWGYCGILSLGHGAFFALGGYAMGMYLMRQIHEVGWNVEGRALRHRQVEHRHQHGGGGEHGEEDEALADCGILSLGHGAFFALGGYAMGMYLMRQIGPRGVYGLTASSA